MQKGSLIRRVGSTAQVFGCSGGQKRTPMADASIESESSEPSSNIPKQKPREARWQR